MNTTCGKYDKGTFYIVFERKCTLEYIYILEKGIQLHSSLAKIKSSSFFFSINIRIKHN